MSMSIEEVKQNLDDATANGTQSDVDYWRGYLAAAIAMQQNGPAAQPNEPLTEAELRCMVGEWVWVTVHYEHCDTSGWAFVCTGTRLGYLDQILDIKDLGTKFVARRRPPEDRKTTVAAWRQTGEEGEQGE